MRSSIRFEPEGLSSGRLLYVQIWYTSVLKKSQLDVNYVFFICLLLVAQHVSGNHVPIIRN
jgi:hypothetical protein